MLECVRVSGVWVYGESFVLKIAVTAFLFVLLVDYQLYLAFAWDHVLCVGILGDWISWWLHVSVCGL